MWKNLKQWWDYFLIGILAIIPIFIIVQIVIYTERLLRDVFQAVFINAGSYLHTLILFAVTIAVFTYIGYKIRNRKAHLLYLLESWIEKIPFIGTVYRIVRKLVSFVGGGQDRKLRDVVYIEYPNEGLWVPAFVTNHHNEHYVLYVPTSPNPTSGFTIIVHQSRVRHSAMSLEEASSFVVTLGVEYAKPEEATHLQ